MKLKQAKQICFNINAENITTEDKLEAIYKVLSSQNPQYALTKSELVNVIKFLMSQESNLKYICLKEKCTYRKQVEPNKAFCMLPKCPFDKCAKVMPMTKELLEKQENQG